MKRIITTYLMTSLSLILLAQTEDFFVDMPIKNDAQKWENNYDAWAGNYIFFIKNKDGIIDTLDVELVPVADRSVYLMKGVNPNYDLTLVYNKVDNTLELQPQAVGEPLADGHVVLLAGWANGPGYVHYGLYAANVAAGMKTYWSEADQMFRWVDNGKWGSYQMNGYILYEFNGRTRVGQISLIGEQGAYAINGSARIYGMEGLKPKFKNRPISITINPPAITMSSLGETKQLEVEVLPIENTDKSVKWSSSNTEVCMVTQNGTIIATGDGISVIVAITNDGFLPATCVVTVDTTLSDIKNTTFSEGKTLNVYSVSGIKVREKSSSLEGLPRGVYIVNGKKCVVK